MKTFIAKKLKDLPEIAKQMITENTTEKVFAFYGKMGSGKTTLIKELCKFMGVNDIVTSPTFALINVYTAKPEDRIYHFDFYRIESLEEAYDMGYEEYFFDNKYCFIEWPELVENLLPESYIKVSISVDDNENRIFELERISD